MKRIAAGLLLLVLFCLLPARDLDEYRIGASVKDYPELSFVLEHDGSRIFNSPKQETAFCLVSAKELKIVADSLNRISSKLVTLRGKTELEALQVLSVWNKGLKDRFGKCKSMVVDGRPIESSKQFDAKLSVFFQLGESFDIIYPGQNASNIVSLKRLKIDDEVSYDISVFIANNKE